MGCCCCTSRGFMIAICVLQLSFTACRQLFDLLGYMWAPILANFFNFLFVIFGLFGIYQYRPRYVFTYILWTFAWIVWNAFCVCFYLEVGFLNRELSYLNMGTGSRSWFEINGFGCKAMFEPHTPDELAGFTKPASVEGCLLEYYHVETIQALVQVFLGVLAIFGGSCVIYSYTQEDPTSARRKGPWALDPLHRSTASLPYSIEYHHVSNHGSQPGSFNRNGKYTSSSLTSSANSSQRRKRRSLRSNRSAQRASYQNPVTRLIDRYVDTSSQDSYNHLAEYLKTTNNALNNNTYSNALSLSNVGQVNRAYDNRFSIASSGTYGVVENMPSPPYSLYNPNLQPVPPPRNVETNM